MKTPAFLAHYFAFTFLCCLAASPASGACQLTLSARTVEVNDFIELTLTSDAPATGNPFLETMVRAEFTPPGGQSLGVDGFCDSEDGRVHRVRFMPSTPGRHEYNVTLQTRGATEVFRGTFDAKASSRPGVVGVDPDHPFHFQHGRSGPHFFYLGTTAYWLLGWQEDTVIRGVIDRLARLKINRIRVALAGRTHGGDRWKEALIQRSDRFQFRLEPWVAARPLNIGDPGYDVTRFNLDFFRKAERMLRHARDRGMQVSLIFYLDGQDPGVDPFGKLGMGGPDERRYYRYTVARLAAFANVMWDVTNEWHLFRNEQWVNEIGTLLKSCDPYHHLVTSHGQGTFPFRTQPWADYAEFQCWDEHGSYDFMLRNRQEQLATGRKIPQVNEEYGYEDHYPFPWGEGRKWPARVAENRRRLAWEISMAGAYQTTGERANVVGYGGWINGAGNDEMTMLEGYAHLRSFFETISWWKLEPARDLTGTNALCLAEPGECYVAYLPWGGSSTLKLVPGTYAASWFNPRTGHWRKVGKIRGGIVNSPMAPDNLDWALLLRRTGH